MLKYVLPLLLLGCATTARVDDRAQLLALHEKALVAHRQSNVEILLEDEGDDYVIANAGNVSRPTKAQRASALGPYLTSTRFTSYVDSVPPIVNVSRDGTLGWVIARVAARGVQQGEQGEEPLEFISAWIELYEKRDGRWTRTGNVSNFKPAAR